MKRLIKFLKQVREDFNNNDGLTSGIGVFSFIVIVFSCLAIYSSLERYAVLSKDAIELFTILISYVYFIGFAMNCGILLLLLIVCSFLMYEYAKDTWRKTKYL